MLIINQQELQEVRSLAANSSRAEGSPGAIESVDPGEAQIGYPHWHMAGIGFNTSEQHALLYQVIASRMTRKPLCTLEECHPQVLPHMLHLGGLSQWPGESQGDREATGSCCSELRKEIRITPEFYPHFPKVASLKTAMQLALCSVLCLRGWSNACWLRTVAMILVS